MAGRKPKPTELKVLQGTQKKCRINEYEPKPKGDLQNPPEYFSDEQRDIWHYAIENAPKGLLKRLDMSVLEIWVTASLMHREASQKVAKSGQVIKSPSDYPIINPYLAIMNKQAMIMLKAASEMGFTPSSRSRVYLKENEESENKFANNMRLLGA